MPTVLLLDSNIYDRLATDAVVRDQLQGLVEDGLLRVIATPVIIDELAASPFKGLPSWFRIDFQAESVAVLGYWRVGMAHVGEGQVFTSHRGQSQQTKDAIIADSAHTFANVLVTEDQRARRRLEALSSQCRAVNFDGLKDLLQQLTIE